MVGGLYENYITPEQTIPTTALHVPWESCITIGTSFSFAYEDNYKTPRELVHLLIEVVAKGGNLALNVGPQPDGRLPRGAVEAARGLGAWLQDYGEAIYGTRICEPYFHNDWAFTKKGNYIYAFKLYQPDEEIKPKLTVPVKQAITEIKLMNKAKITFHQDAGGIQLELPAEELSQPAPIAHVFRLQKKQD